MNVELSGNDRLFVAGFLHQPFGQGVLFPMSHHPSDHVSAENIHDHVEVEIGPLGWSLEFGDIPGPHLIGLGREQLRFFVVGPPHLISTFLDLAMLLFQNAIHRPDRAVILPFIQKHGIDLGGRIILESWRMEQVDDRLPLLGIKSQGRGRSRSRMGYRIEPSVKGGSGCLKGRTCFHGSNFGSQLLDRGHESFSSFCWEMPKRSEIFF